MLKKLESKCLSLPNLIAGCATLLVVCMGSLAAMFVESDTKAFIMLGCSFIIAGFVGNELKRDMEQCMGGWDDN